MAAVIFLTLTGLTMLGTACAHPNGDEFFGPREHNTLSPEEREQGWRLLFDGETTDGWRGFRMESMPDGWQVVDGALVRVEAAGDIITVEQFENFELALEWRVQEAGNSGIMYRVSEDARRTHHTGPEMQVLDDAGHPDGRSCLTAAGAVYGLYPAPKGIVNPAGDWNQTRLLIDGSHVEHWLNGEKVVDYELGSPDWEAKIATTKFAGLSNYGRVSKGHIALQDHGDWVAYRNIKIRILP